jgi:hypothetical protein
MIKMDKVELHKVEIQQIAREVLRCATHWQGQARILGNVQADEIAALCRYVLKIKGKAICANCQAQHQKYGYCSTVPFTEVCNCHCHLT